MKKRISVALFLMMALFCAAYGYSFHWYEKRANSINEEIKNIKENQENVIDGEIADGKTNADKYAAADSNKTEQAFKDGSAQDNSDDIVHSSINAEDVEASSKVPDWKYYVVYSSDKLTVYLKDKVTVFEETAIDESHMTSEYKEKLIRGICVKNEDELYSLLESLSS